MRFANVLRSLVLLALLAAPARSPATSYVLMSDRDLADRAGRIVRGRVETVQAAGERAALEYRVAVERTLQGAGASTVTVRVPGIPAPAAGPALKVWGAPAFVSGERVLLFLVSNGDGTERILHLALGAFRVVDAAGGRALAIRLLPDAREVPGIGTRATDAERHGWRDLERFEAWLRDRTARRADYFVADGGARPGALVAAGGRSEVWGGLRWFEFDGARRGLGRVRWRSGAGGQAGLPGAGHRELRAALRAWTRHRGSNVAYVYDGVTDAAAGLESFDNENTVLFDRLVDEPFDCVAGGVLALGGPWYDEEQPGTFRGRRYYRIVGADIEVARGAECFFAMSRDPRRAAHELLAHELGHTLGLGHACGDESSGECVSTRQDQALMRAFIHDDGRGARLMAHDRAALCALYPQGALAPEACAARR